jgi:hypothetical protein
VLLGDADDRVEAASARPDGEGRPLGRDALDRVARSEGGPEVDAEVHEREGDLGMFVQGIDDIG